MPAKWRTALMHRNICCLRVPHQAGVCGAGWSGAARGKWSLQKVVSRWIDCPSREQMEGEGSFMAGRHSSVCVAVSRRASCTASEGRKEWKLGVHFGIYIAARFHDSFRNWVLMTRKRGLFTKRQLRNWTWRCFRPKRTRGAELHLVSCE